MSSILTWDEHVEQHQAWVRKNLADGEELKIVRARASKPKPVEGMDRTIEYVASGEKTDRYGDVIRVKGWDLVNWKANPQFIWSHNYDIPPLGVGKKAWKDQTGDEPLLRSFLSYFDEETNGFADAIYKIVLAGGLRGVSVGFLPQKHNDPKETEEREEIGLGKWGVEYLKQELLEISQVTVPAYAGALSGRKAEFDEFIKSLAMASKDHGFGKDHAKVFVEQAGDMYATAATPVLRDLSLLAGAKEVVVIGKCMQHSTLESSGCGQCGNCCGKETEEEKAVEKPGWDETEDYYRYRVRNPDLFVEGSMRTKTLQKKPLIKSIMGKLTADGDDAKMVVQNVMFGKKDWTLADAKKWLKDHPELKKSFADLQKDFPDLEEMESGDQDALIINVEEDKAIDPAILKIAGDALKPGETMTITISKGETPKVVKIEAMELKEFDPGFEKFREIVKEEIEIAMSGLSTAGTSGNPGEQSDQGTDGEETEAGNQDGGPLLEIMKTVGQTNETLAKKE